MAEEMEIVDTARQPVHRRPDRSPRERRELDERRMNRRVKTGSVGRL